MFFSETQKVAFLTTHFRLLVRVVSTVVLTVTPPAQGFAKGVVALELVLGAVSSH